MIDSRWLFLNLLLACVACNGTDRVPQPAADTVEDTVTGPRNVTLPNQKLDSIRIEGMWQPLTLELVKPESSLPFVTYVPSDMVAEASRSAEGEAHYFYAKFGGTRNKDAFLLVFIFPPGTTQEEAVRTAREFRDERARPAFVVNADLRRRGDRFYFLAEHYPAEYGDGFGPRSQRIQDEWQWLAEER